LLYIILPAFNEEKSIEKLFTKIRGVMDENHFEYEIVAVNDGSSDKTAELLQKYSTEMPVHVITHKLNRGLGETIRDGFEWAAEVSKPDDIIIRMDCDDTHEPKYIIEMVKKINEGYDVVITSRFQPGAKSLGVGGYHNFISTSANRLMKLFFPIKGVWEYSCGYRAYRAIFIKEAIRIFGNNFIELKGVGFTCTLEKILKLRMMNAKMIEIPFTLRYDQKKSPSKMVSSITTIGYIVLTLKNIYPWGDTAKGWHKEIKKLDIKR
jgi:dolichol-phosphate mannosyltransferase